MHFPAQRKSEPAQLWRAEHVRVLAKCRSILVYFLQFRKRGIWVQQN